MKGEMTIRRMMKNVQQSRRRIENVICAISEKYQGYHNKDLNYFEGGRMIEGLQCAKREMYEIEKRMRTIFRRESDITGRELMFRPRDKITMFFVYLGSALRIYIKDCEEWLDDRNI